MPERVKVLVRVRPFLPTDPADADLSLFVMDNSHICVNERHVFEVDKVYRMEDDTAMVFQEHIEPMIEAFLDGYNATAMAYGQTGTGKTYTISGLVPFLMDRIINGGFGGRADTLAFQYIEVYGELLRDLLQPHSHTLTKGLQVWNEAPNVYMEDHDEAGEGSLSNPVRRAANVTVPDAVYGRCHTVQDALQLVEKGARRRATAATNMNEDSSRSHSILTIINTKNNAKFNLVDLAGSERNKKTRNTGQRFKESIAINTGLLALGNVIRALYRNHTHHVAGHVPYRSSKLTRLLQDSFGGNSKTLFIACIAPDSYNSDESLRTLQYCALAKKILNEPLKNTEVQPKRSSPALECESEMVPLFSAEQINAYEELCQYCLSQEDELEDLRVELGAAQERLSLCEDELRNDEAVFTRQINEIKRLVARNKELERRVEQLEEEKAKENRENERPATTTNPRARPNREVQVQKEEQQQQQQARAGALHLDTLRRDEQMAALAKEALLHQNQNAELRNRLSAAVSLLDAQRRESALLRLELNEINALLGGNAKNT